MENLRKRTDREIADSRAYAVAAFARDVLGVADNMRRALDAISPELRASAESGVKALIEGVELTERELQKALEKNGVSQFTPRGEKFDPNVHQAMFEVPDAGGAGGQRRRGRAARLHDRRAHAAAGVGRRVEGWPKNRSRTRAGRRQRQRSKGRQGFSDTSPPRSLTIIPARRPLPANPEILDRSLRSAFGIPNCAVVRPRDRSTGSS